MTQMQGILSSSKFHDVILEREKSEEGKSRVSVLKFHEEFWPDDISRGQRIVRLAGVAIMPPKAKTDINAFLFFGAITSKTAMFLYL